MSSEKRENAIDRAIRFAAEREESSDNQQRLHSRDGVTHALKEFGIIQERLREINDQLTLNAPSLGVAVGSNRECTILTAPGASVKISWNQKYEDTVRDGYLSVAIYRGRLSLPGHPAIQHGVEEENIHRYAFDHTRELGWCWRHLEIGTYVRSVDIADDALDALIRIVERADRGEKPPPQFFGVGKAETEYDPLDDDDTYHPLQ